MKKLIFAALIVLFCSCERDEFEYVIYGKVTYTHYFNSSFYFKTIVKDFELPKEKSIEKAIEIRAEKRTEDVVTIWINNKETKAIRKSICDIKVLPK